jgi:hypothetical protein
MESKEEQKCSRRGQMCLSRPLRYNLLTFLIAYLEASSWPGGGEVEDHLQGILEKVPL